MRDTGAPPATLCFLVFVFVFVFFLISRVPFRFGSLTAFLFVPFVPYFLFFFFLTLPAQAQAPLPDETDKKAISV